MKFLRSSLGLVTAICAVFTLVVPAYANVTDGGIKGYAAATPIDIGTIVQLDGKKSDHVKSATSENQQNMFGVVIDRNQLAITLSNEGLKNETYVAVSGTYNTLVSTQNGPIHSGDFVALSSIDGIAMKAGLASEQSTVYGRAQGSFDGKGVVLGTMNLKDSTGSTRSVALGQIPVTIDIKRNPNEKTTKVNVPSQLEKVGQAIADKPVTPVRLYLSAGIAVVSLLAAIIVLYTGVRSGVISIGRNPMSKKSIFRAIFETILTSALILIIGLFAVYLLLKL